MGAISRLLLCAAGVAAAYALPILFFWPVSEMAPIVAALVLLLIWISLSDLETTTIPDLGVLLVAVLGGINSFHFVGGNLLSDVVAAILIMAPLALFGDWVWARRGVDVLGLGDVKLIGAGVLVVGLHSVWLMIFLASIGGIVAASLARHRKAEGIPFGPFIAYAILITFLIRIPGT